MKIYPKERDKNLMMVSGIRNQPMPCLTLKNLPILQNLGNNEENPCTTHNFMDFPKPQFWPFGYPDPSLIKMYITWKTLTKITDSEIVIE